MGLRFHRSIRLGSLLRLNLSKRGVGIGARVPGASVSMSSTGKVSSSVGVPGTGISYRSAAGDWAAILLALAVILFVVL